MGVGTEYLTIAIKVSRKISLPLDAYRVFWVASGLDVFIRIVWSWIWMILASYL